MAREREHELQSSHHRDRDSPRNQEFVSAAADQHSHRGRAEVGEGGRMSSPGRDRGGVYGNRERSSDVSGRTRDDRRLLEDPSLTERGRLRERGLEEERRYGGRSGGDFYPSRAVEQRGRWEGRREERSTSRQVRFEDDYEDDVERINLPEPRGGCDGRKRWDEEEEGIMQWARGQGKSGGPGVKNSRAPTPPSYSSTRRNVEGGGVNGGSRSLSAPVVAGGIAALGAGNTDIARKRKQREYAEQLRAQMREKQVVKERERFSSGDVASSPRYRETRQTLVDSDSASRLRANTDDHRSSVRRERDRPPRHDERVRFSPERGDRRERAKYEHPQGPHYGGYNTAFDSTSKTGYPPPPQHWPGLYYGGFPYPPPPNFPLPPPTNGLPFYPPPPSMHPSLSSPYLAAGYYHPPPAGADLEYGRGGPGRAKHHDREDRERLRDRSSPQRANERGGRGEETVLSSSGGDKTVKMSKDAYRTQLMEQMREKQDNKQRARIERDKFERKQELEVYDPFGKGGCGAPIRDRRGKLVTNLQQMKKVNDERMMFGLPSTTPLPGEGEEGGAAGVVDNSFTNQESPRFTSSYELRKSNEFQNKVVQEGYKEALVRQMKEREASKKQEKEKKEQMEKVEAERIEKELKTLEEKYKHEKEREREKQFELKLKNEALNREKEEKAADELEKKRWNERAEQEKARLAEEKKNMLINNMEQQLPSPSKVRSNSPLIPTLRNTPNARFANPQSTTIPNQPYEQTQHRSTSPPVPTLHHKQQLGGGPQQVQSAQTFTTAASQPPIEHHQPRSGSPIVPALRKKLAAAAAESASSAAPEQPQVPHSSSLHALPPSSLHALPPSHSTAVAHTSSTNHANQRIGPSFSAHQLPAPPVSQAPIPTSTSHLNLSPAPTQLPLPPPQLPASDSRSAEPADDKVEDMLKNLRSMRRMLESERQKVTIQKQPESTTTTTAAAATDPSHSKTDTGSSQGESSGGTSGAPGFWKPRLAAPRRSAAASDHAPQQQRGEQQQQQHRQRRQWQATSDESGALPPPPPQVSQTSPQLGTTLQSHALPRFSRLAGKENVFPTGGSSTHYHDDPMKHNPSPVWLQSGVPPGGSNLGSLGPSHSNPHGPRAPSVGGQSQFSITTLDVDSMARRNEERMQRLDSILNTQARDTRTPQTILSNFLTRHSQTRHAQPTHPAATTSTTRYPFSSARGGAVVDRAAAGEFTSLPPAAPTPTVARSRLSQRSRDHELDCETGYQPLASTPS